MEEPLSVLVDQQQSRMKYQQQAAAAAPQLMKEGGIPVSPKPYAAEASVAAGSN